MPGEANTSKALHKPVRGRSRYRPEIDGLRAFAVVAVIINHVNKDLLPSGYLGVDIFCDLWLCDYFGTPEKQFAGAASVQQQSRGESSPKSQLCSNG
jgi:hypothetical protein